MLSKLSPVGRLTASPLQHQQATTPCQRSLVVRASTQDDAFVNVCSRVFAAAAAATVAFSSLLGGTSAAAATVVPLLAEQQYEQQVQRLHHKPPLSHLPNSNEAAALQMLLDPDMFTPEAWQGMVRLHEYAQYVDQLAAAGVEDAPGCESCTANRMMLEKVGQQGYTLGI
jgi:hypothetical protein